MRPLPVNLLPEESTLPTWRSLLSQFLPSGLSNCGMHATSQSSDFTLIAWMNHIFKTILKVLKPASVYFYFLDSEKQKALNTSPKCCCWTNFVRIMNSLVSEWSKLVEARTQSFSVHSAPPFWEKIPENIGITACTQDIPRKPVHTHKVSVHSRPTPMYVTLTTRLLPGLLIHNIDIWNHLETNTWSVDQG